MLGKLAAGQDDPPCIVGFNRGKTVVLGKQAIMRTRFAARLRAYCRVRGFTLVELMITLAVAAILAMIAVPSFRHILISTNLSNINNDLAGDLQYARTEAVSRQVSVQVAATGSWQNGWTVQVPPASSTGTATVLRTHAAIPTPYVLSGAATPVTFQPQGTSALNCFTVSAPNGAANNQPRFLQVLAAGMLQQTTSSTTPPGCPAPAP